MRIGIDISQLAYENTGVANYLRNLILALVKNDEKNEYILFFSSLRKNFKIENLNFDSTSNVKIKKFKLPQSFLNFIWNNLHIAPIEWFVGDIDLFITSDWCEPPAKSAKKATIIYDLIVYKYPQETAQKIVTTHKKKLAWVKKESDIIFCISESTKKDASEILGLDKNKLKVIYPGIL